MRITLRCEGHNLGNAVPVVEVDVDHGMTLADIKMLACVQFLSDSHDHSTFDLYRKA